MGIISVENTDHLFWLGRYSERVYTTTRLFADSYDHMIDLDVDFNSYEDFCKRLDIPNLYESKEDFCNRYCFDETLGDSIVSNLMRAYDNAIVLREEIGSEPLSYIQLAVYAMNLAKKSESPLIELQKIIDNILAFWGIVDDQIESENVRNIIKIGKRVERLDIYGRLELSRTELLREYHRLSGRIDRTCLKYNRKRLEKMNEILYQDAIDYEQLVDEVDHLLEG